MPVTINHIIRWEVQVSSDGEAWGPTELGKSFATELACRAARQRLDFATQDIDRAGFHRR